MEQNRHWHWHTCIYRLAHLHTPRKVIKPAIHLFRDWVFGLSRLVDNLDLNSNDAHLSSRSPCDWITSRFLNAEKRHLSVKGDMACSLRAKSCNVSKLQRDRSTHRNTDPGWGGWHLDKDAGLREANHRVHERDCDTMLACLQKGTGR